MILRPGQCDIKQLTFTSNSGEVLNIENGILEYIDSIDIFESVFTPYVVVDMVMVDGSNFRERFNISGDEDLIIEFKGYGSENTVFYNLGLVETKGIITTENLRSKSVALRFASKEYIYDSTLSVFKSYSVSVEEIIKDIHKTYLRSSKPLTVEPSKDFPTVVIPFLSPFSALSFLRKRAVSEQNPSSPFLVFENQKGIFFTTIDHIFKSGGAGSSEIFTYHQQEAVSSNIKGSQGTITDYDAFKIFSNYSVNSPVDLAHLLDEGGLNTVIAEFDLTTKQYRRRLFTNQPGNNSFTRFTKESNEQLTREIFQKYSQFVGKGMLIPSAKYKDTVNPTNNFIYDSLAEKVSFTNIFTQQKTYVDVPGNVKIMAGSIVNLQVPRHNGLNEKKDKNEMDSGLYMVSSVRHTIQNSIDAKYTTHLELMRYGRGVFER